ncbi:extracellular solute-binding protein [Gluconacetobacter johannae DSM 13595]|nr:extracellular solute-binding protein [Gluconacetobacter johannae DSM 13595]
MRVAAAVLGMLVLWCLTGLSGARRPGLVIYSSVGASPAVASAFTRETGIPATVVVMSTGGLLARVSAEAHHPRWDVLWFEGDGGAAALDRSGLLARGLTPDLDWTPVGRGLLPADGAYVVTSFTLAGVFLSRTGRGPASSPGPSDLSAVRVGMPNPALSGPAYPLLAGMMEQGGGWPAGQAVLRRMGAAGLLVAPSNPSVLLALRAGRIDVGLVQSSAAITLSRQDSRYAVRIPRPAIILPAVAAVAADRPADRRRVATGFLRFVMRPDIQAIRMHQSSHDHLFWPVTTAPAQPDLPDIATLRLIHPDPTTWGLRQAEVTTWFERTIVR